MAIAIGAAAEGEDDRIPNKKPPFRFTGAGAKIEIILR